MVECFETSCGFHPIAEAENNLDQKAPDLKASGHTCSVNTHISFPCMASFASFKDSEISPTGGRKAQALLRLLPDQDYSSCRRKQAASSVGVDVIHENSFRSMAGNIDLAPSVATVPGYDESDMIGFVPAGAAFSKRR